MQETKDTERGKSQKKQSLPKWDRKNRHRYGSPQFWKPGEALTEEDEKLLEPVRRRYRELGYSPSKRDMEDTRAIRQRFRIWKDTLLAAGLPDYNDPDETRKRMALQEERKQQGGAVRSQDRQEDPEKGN